MLTINLENQIALVTGVSSGIGAGVAKMLAKAGCHVAGCGTRSPSSEGAQQFVNTVKTTGSQAHYFQVDVTKEEELKMLVTATVKLFGGIDVVVSNAGQNVFKGALECSQEDWAFNHNLNLKSHWCLSRFASPYLKNSQNGALIIMTSNHAFTSMPGCFPYNVTKTALVGLVRSLAIEWGPDIRVVGLAPGFIQTAGGEAWFERFVNPADEKNRTMRLHPVGKLGTVEEVGAFCAFLASDFGRFITGTTYLMDGGRSALMQDDSK